MSPDGFLAVAVDLSFSLVVGAIVMGFFRLAKGPSLPDRVVSLDLMTILIVGFCGLFSVFAGDATFLDIGLVLALVGFLATVALARFAERRGAARDDGVPAKVVPPPESETP